MASPTETDFQINEYETLPKEPLFKPAPPSTNWDNPATTSLVTEFKNQSARLMPSRSFQAEDFGDFNSMGKDQRLSVTTTGPDKSAYTELSDGTLTPRLDMFNTGLSTSQNEDMLAKSQSTSEKYGRGLYTHLFKGLGTKVVGGTVGVVNGLVQAVKMQSLSAMYDNDLNRYLGDIDKRTQASNAIYKREGYDDMNFGQKLMTADFVADEVLGGISFLAGTIISESIWGLATGGTGLLAKGALGAVGRGITKLGAGKSMDRIMNLAKGEGSTLIRGTAKKSVENLRTAGIAAGKAQEVLNTTRFLFTSAGYESSVEALGFMEEAEAKFINEKLTNEGVYPSPEELAQFKSETVNAGNAVFGANMALVGFSNLTVLGKTLLGSSVNRKLSTNYFKKTAFGVGYTKEGGKLVATEASRAQRNFSRAFSVGKKAFTEGFIEEGGQSATGGAALNYVMSGYDQDATNDNISAIEAMYEGLKETYTSKEGLTEVGLGVLIGVLGGGMSTRYQFNEYIQEGKDIGKIVKHVNGYTSKQLVDQLKTSNKINMANKAGEAADAAGDLTGKMSADTAAMAAMAERAFRYQGVDESIKDFQVALDEMPLDVMAKEMGITEEEAATWKGEKMAEFSETMKEHGKNLQFAQSLLGGVDIAGLSAVKGTLLTEVTGTKEDLESAIAYTMTMGKRSDEFAEAMATQIKQMVAFDMQPEGVQDAITVNGILRKVNAKAQSTYAKSRARVDDLAQKFAILERQLVEAQNAPEVSEPGKVSAKAQRLSKLNAAILDVQGKLDQATAQKTASYNALNIPQYTQEIVTEEMLDNQANNVSQLETAMKNIEMRDPQQAAILSKVFEEYGKAVRQTKAYNDLIQGILNPEVRVNTLNGLLSSMINKRKKLNEPTEAFFTSAMRNWLENEAKVVGVQGVGATGSNVDAEEDEETKQPPADENPLDNPPENVADKVEQEAAKRQEKEDKPQDPSVAIQKQINDIVKKDPYTNARYSGELTTTLEEVKPTQEDVDAYNGLLGKITEGVDKQGVVLQNTNPQDSGLTDEEFRALINLNNKLNNWQILSGFEQDGSSLAELLHLMAQLKETFTPNSVQAETTVKDFFKPTQAKEKDSNKDSSRLNTVIAPAEVVVNKVDSTYEISHLKIESLPGLFPDARVFVQINGNAVAVEGIPADKLADLNQNADTEIIVKGENYEVNFVTNDRQRLIAPVKELDAAIPQSKFRVLDFGNGNYMPMFVSDADGNFTTRDGDFTIESTIPNELITVTSDSMYGLAPGTLLRTVVNLNDSYNAKLLEDYKNGAITEQFLINNISIYLSEQGRVNEALGLMRAIKDSTTTQTPTYDKLYMIRKQAVKKALKSKTSRVEVGISVTFKKTLIGSPNVSVTEGTDGKVVPQNIEITDEALEMIEDFGYIEDLKITTNKGVEYTNSEAVFARAASGKEKNKGNKVPVVVFKYKGRTVVFPVSLVSQPGNQAQEFDNILNKPGQSQAATIYAINQLLLDNNIDPSTFNITDLESDSSKAGLQAAFAEVSKAPNYANPVDWVQPGFKKASLQGQAQIALDITGRPFGAPKGILDLEKTALPDEVDMDIEAVANLDNWAKRMENLFREADRLGKGPFVNMTDNSNFYNAYSEKGINMTANSYIMHKYNAKILIESFNQSIPKAVREILGQEAIKNIRAEIKQYQIIAEGIKTNKNALAGSLKNDIDNEENNCNK